jgi:hypothetical protein
MVKEDYILEQFGRLALQDQINVLWKALEYMDEEENDRAKADCVALVMGIPLFPKVKDITGIDGYKITVLFNHGEERLIDFGRFFSKKRRFEKILLEDYGKFSEVEVIDGTLAWPELGVLSQIPNGKQKFYHYDIDPALLYEHSVGSSSSSRQ